jgi:DNA-directed RNA polymerase specialized sigma subunit
VTATRARSTRVRPQADPCPDQERLGSFPAPTAWSEQLAAENLQLARSMASRLARTTRMPFDDLYLVAAQGLLKGCRIYDPERINPGTGEPYRLSTCVVPYIRGAMFHWLRDRGHTSGVKFPDRWRDKAPIVRRMAAKGSTLEEVITATGLSSDDVEGILQAQGATQVLDPEDQDFAVGENTNPDPWDDLEAHDNLAEALRIADLAHASLKFADRAMLEFTWIAPKPYKRQLARLPYGQFLAKAKGVIRLGAAWPDPQIIDQPSLPLDGKSAEEILMVAEQLALLAEAPQEVTPKKTGKTPTAGIGRKGAASGNQPSIK